MSGAKLSWRNVKVKVKVAQLCLTLWDSMDYTVHRILQARILEWVALPFSRGFSQPRDWTQVSRIAGGFLPTEPKGKPKKTGVGSLSLLQGIFLAQGSNWGLLHCRWILEAGFYFYGQKKIFLRVLILLGWALIEPNLLGWVWYSTILIYKNGNFIWLNLIN